MAVNVVQEIIAEVMKREGVKPEDIPEDSDIDPSKVDQIKSPRCKRYFCCKGFAHFKTHEDPSGGGHTKSWPSAHSWCTLDLKKQCIAYRWIQKCNKCEGESKPWFDEEALEKMAEFVVNLYLIKIRAREREERDINDGRRRSGRGPHDQARCGMCKAQGGSCWK